MESSLKENAGSAIEEKTEKALLGLNKFWLDKDKDTVVLLLFVYGIHLLNVEDETPIIREAPTKKVPLLFGHCPNCDCPPPPHSTGHSGALYFQTNLSNFVKSPF